MAKFIVVIYLFMNRISGHLNSDSTNYYSCADLEFLNLEFLPMMLKN